MRFDEADGEATEEIAGPYDSVEAAFAATEGRRDYDRGYRGCTIQVEDARGNISRLARHPLEVDEMEHWEQRQARKKKPGR